MKQPELGRTIADLRKAKGLTQEELVDVCNLNVRTLQRIESGEVTPRTYTLKIISDALDFDMNLLIVQTNGIGKKQDLFGKLKPAWFYFKDLFNFKTYTMRKIMTLSTVLLAMAICLMAFRNKEVINTQSSKEVREYIEAIQAKYKQWYESGMMDSCVTIFSDDVCLINNWSILNGKEAVRTQLFKVQHNQYRILEGQIESFSHSGNIAIVSGSSTIKDVNGNIYHSKYMDEWHYIEGKWLQVKEIEVFQ